MAGAHYSYKGLCKAAEILVFYALLISSPIYSMKVLKKQDTKIIFLVPSLITFSKTSPLYWMFLDLIKKYLNYCVFVFI